MTLWSWHELCEALNVPVTDQHADATGVSIDSRTLAPGDIFIALSGDPGPRFHSSSAGDLDGHDFLKAAVQAEASSVMIRGDYRGDVAIPVLPVPDTLEGLWALGRAARHRTDAHIVAVTGSAGKTTCRSWLEALLSEQAPTHASTGSLNNHWGVPLSMSRMPAEVHYGVFEVGTNNPGEIALLTELVRPDVAVVLNVLPAHIGRFPSMDDLRLEKLSLAEGLGETGIVIAPSNLDLNESAAMDRDVLTFGLSSDADIWSEWGSVDHRGIDEASIHVGDQRLVCHPPFKGDHRLLTLTAVFAALAAVKADLEKAARDVVRLTVPTGRGEVIKAGDWTLVDDSYNANPVSVLYAVNALAGEGGHRVAVLGEMLELGPDGPSAHEEVLLAAMNSVDQVFTVGENWPPKGQERLDPQLDDAVLTALVDRIEYLAKRPPTVLIKGANKVFWAKGFVDRLNDALRTRHL